MKLKQFNERLKNTIFIFLISLTLFAASISAQTKTPLRRPISPQQPMWLIHIDTWNYPDAQKIIDLVPKDIRPYVVMNISLSISHDEANGRYKVAEYGYEIAKSWLRVCAENQMWAMVQPSSGGYSQFSDFDMSVYEEFFSEYPNFIGLNYCEQFWGFDSPTDPLSAKWADRMNHFANLLKVSNKYGGYLAVSWCANQWSPSINPIAMMKRNPAFAAACRDYTENYILCEKYTQQSYQSDMESICLGAYLSGYSGNYGIRYDDTGWTDPTGVNANFTMATALVPHFEHAMLTGQTVIDGPELIWTQCFKEISSTTTPDGFSRRNWQTFSQFDNVNVDIFRKILDGTVRIPTRQEVIDRTKIVVINDVNTNDVNATYSSPQTLFEGLYRMDGDGNYENNKSFFKKTGRYPTIPTVFQLDDEAANSFQLKINRSAYSSKWPSVASKVNELNQLFPQEYTGDLYAGRHENGWVTYNPYKTGKLVSGTIPFKYNTCDSMTLKYGQYSAGVIKEYPNKLTFYLNNYDNVINTNLKNDTIVIYGSTNEPTYTSTDRTKAQASIVTKSWANGVFTLVVKHNGALDIEVDCSGTATGRLTNFTPATLVVPEKPALYTGPRQYEVECADYKSVSLITSGFDKTIRNYTGQGYIIFGTSANAAIRDTVNVLRKGVYQLQSRYIAPAGDVSTIDLYVNGTKVATPTFSKTANGWAVNTQNITLNEGSNTIMLKANAAGKYTSAFDNFLVTQASNDRIYDFTSDEATLAAGSPAAQFVTVKSGSAGVVTFTDGNNQASNCIKAYSAGTTNGTGVADLDLFPPSVANYYVVWKEYYGTSDGKKGILLRGTDANGLCPYAEGLKQGYLFVSQNNSDGTVTLTTHKAGATELMNKTTFTSIFKVNQNEACWYRASANDNNFTFECSKDSINWFGATTTKFTDNSYSTGSTQLVWGLNSNNFSWLMDNINCGTPFVSISKLELTNLGYTYGSGPGKSDSIFVSATSLIDNLVLISPDNFEISLNRNSGFTNSLTINKVNGNVVQTKVYVRAKAGVEVNTYTGLIEISSTGITTQTVKLSGTILPLFISVTKMYDFTNDVATTSAKTPPSLFTTIGAGNSATAGVVSYTDSKSITSNVLKPYSCGIRNLTGVVDLNLFNRKAVDYSVTWKQCLIADKEYKVGVLLRGDTTGIGTATVGYEAGMMHGYLFIVNNKTSGGAEFRIYKSDSSTGLNRVSTGSATALVPTSNQPIWYRASATGTSPVNLKFEFSTDSVTWITGTTYNDSSVPFASGATQLVWGLGLSSVDFYVDNITYLGKEQAHFTAIDDVYQSKDNASIVSTEYYTIMGMKILNPGKNLKGIFIVRNLMSDGSVSTSKIMKK